MKSEIATYIRGNGGTVLRAVGGYVNDAIASDVVRKVAQTLATRILLIILGLATGVLVARMLGPEGRGYYAVAVAIGSTGVQFGNLGLHASNTYVAARDRGQLPYLLGNSLFVSLVFGGFVIAVAWLFFQLMPVFAPLNGTLLILALLWIPFGLASMLSQNLLLGLMDVKAYNAIDLLSTVLAVSLMCILLTSGPVTVESVFAVGLVTLIIGLVFIMRRLRNYSSRFPGLSFDLFRRNIGFGLKVFITDLVSFLVFRIDIFMVNHYLAVKQTGFYSIAVSIADLVYMLPVIIGTILFPKLSSMESGQWQYTKKAAIMVSLLMLPLVLIASALARPAIKLLFGSEFLPAAQPFYWLMPGIYLISIQSILVKYLAINGYPIRIVYIWLLALGINISLNAYLIPAIGISGASLSSSIAYALVMICIFASVLALKQQEMKGSREVLCR